MESINSLLARLSQSERSGATELNDEKNNESNSISEDISEGSSHALIRQKTVVSFHASANNGLKSDILDNSALIAVDGVKNRTDNQSDQQNKRVDTLKVPSRERRPSMSSDLGAANNVIKPAIKRSNTTNLAKSLFVADHKLSASFDVSPRIAAPESLGLKRQFTFSKTALLADDKQSPRGFNRMTTATNSLGLNRMGTLQSSFKRQITKTVAPSIPSEVVTNKKSRLELLGVFKTV